MFFWLSVALYVQSFYFQYFSMFSFSKFSHSSFSRWTLNRSIFSLLMFSRSTLSISMFSRLTFSRLAFSCSTFSWWIISVYPSHPSILPMPSFSYISAHPFCKYTLFHNPLLSLLLSPLDPPPSFFFLQFPLNDLSVQKHSGWTLSSDPLLLPLFFEPL
jgi:hypothetical protein